jgi:hypothetical protein
MIFSDITPKAPESKQCDVHFRFNNGTVVPMSVEIAERYTRKGRGQIVFSKPPRKEARTQGDSND